MPENENFGMMYYCASVCSFLYYILGYFRKLYIVSSFLKIRINPHISQLISSLNVFLQEMVIMHWTCSKITASLAIPDATLLEILLDKVV